MNRLIINTANEELYIVLQVQDALFHRVISSIMHHNETMLPAIDELLTEHSLSIADIDEFGVVIGPGSFTGIRVGISTIKAFRDALNKPARGINNLDLLFALAKSQNEEIETVAILGSRDSYFVAKLINGVVYKYEHNLSLEELKSVSAGKTVGMFTGDNNLPHMVVCLDDKVLVNCFENSTDFDLVPVYYQLSQAENEKLKRAELSIDNATMADLDSICDIERESIATNHMSRKDVENALNSTDYQVLVAKFNGVVVGYIVIQFTDEANVESIAVKHGYRNLGIATKLLNRAVECTKSKNLTTISLEVSDKNITAYVLYQKLGFKERRKRKRYYANGTDCSEMFLTI